MLRGIMTAASCRRPHLRIHLHTIMAALTRWHWHSIEWQLAQVAAQLSVSRGPAQVAMGPGGLRMGCWRTEQHGNGQRASCAWPHQPDSSSLSLRPWRHRHAARLRRRVLCLHAGKLTSTTTRSTRRTLRLSSRVRTVSIQSPLPCSLFSALLC